MSEETLERIEGGAFLQLDLNVNFNLGRGNIGMVGDTARAVSRSALGMTVHTASSPDYVTMLAQMPQELRVTMRPGEPFASINVLGQNAVAIRHSRLRPEFVSGRFTLAFLLPGDNLSFVTRASVPVRGFVFVFGE